MALLPTRLSDAIVQMAEHFQIVLLQCTFTHTRCGEDDVTQLMA